MSDTEYMFDDLVGEVPVLRPTLNKEREQVEKGGRKKERKQENICNYVSTRYKLSGFVSEAKLFC